MENQTTIPPAELLYLQWRDLPACQAEHRRLEDAAGGAKEVASSSSATTSTTSTTSWAELPAGVRDFLSGPFRDATTPACFRWRPSSASSTHPRDHPSSSASSSRRPEEVTARHRRDDAEWSPSQRNLWVGAGVTSRLHFDAHDNLHAVLHGGKVFHLYPPDSARVQPKRRVEGELNNGAAAVTALPGHVIFSGGDGGGGEDTHAFKEGGDRHGGVGSTEGEEAAAAREALFWPSSSSTSSEEEETEKEWEKAKEEDNQRDNAEDEARGGHHHIGTGKQSEEDEEDDRVGARRRRVYRADVRAGHAVFIPAGWWHEVFTLGLAASANAWWPPASPAAALRPTLLQSRSATFADFAAAQRSRRRQEAVGRRGCGEEREEEALRDE